MEPEINKSYIYKPDGRIVKVIYLSPKRERANVIIGESNPFYVNYNDLEEIKKPSEVFGEMRELVGEYFDKIDCVCMAIGRGKCEKNCESWSEY